MRNVWMPVWPTHVLPSSVGWLSLLSPTSIAPAAFVIPQGGRQVLSGFSAARVSQQPKASTSVFDLMSLSRTAKANCIFVWRVASTTTRNACLMTELRAISVIITLFHSKDQEARQHYTRPFEPLGASKFQQTFHAPFRHEEYNNTIMSLSRFHHNFCGVCS